MRLSPRLLALVALASAIGCAGGQVAVFRQSGQLSADEQREWFTFQRKSRAAWDPQIRGCLSAPAPELPQTPAKEFTWRLARTLQSAPRVLRECREDVGAHDLSGQLSLALSFAPEGHALASRVIAPRTQTTHPEFDDCVRTRFCFLKAWPWEKQSSGEVSFDTASVW